MNWDYILSVTPRFIHATLMTLHLAFWGILLSLVIGVICAVITTYKVKSLTWLVKGYIELSRNTPLLIQVFFLYFGLSKIGLKLDGFTCWCSCFSCITACRSSAFACPALPAA